METRMSRSADNVIHGHFSPRWRRENVCQSFREIWFIGEYRSGGSLASKYALLVPFVVTNCEIPPPRVFPTDSLATLIFSPLSLFLSFYSSRPSVSSFFIQHLLYHLRHGSFVTRNSRVNRNKWTQRGFARRHNVTKIFAKFQIPLFLLPHETVEAFLTFSTFFIFVTDLSNFRTLDDFGIEADEMGLKEVSSDIGVNDIWYVIHVRAVTDTIFYLFYNTSKFRIYYRFQCILVTLVFIVKSEQKNAFYIN